MRTTLLEQRDDAQRLPFQQASASAMKLMQSGASAHLMLGMLQNYTEFLGEMYQGWTTMISQGQAALLSQVQEGTDNLIDATAARARRGRQAA